MFKSLQNLRRFRSKDTWKPNEAFLARVSGIDSHTRSRQAYCNFGFRDHVDFSKPWKMHLDLVGGRFETSSKALGGGPAA